MTRAPDGVGVDGGNGARLMIFRRVTTQPDGSRKRLSKPFLISVGVHLVVAVALMRMLIVNMDLSPTRKRQSVAEQRVGFVRIHGGVKNPVPGKSGGDGKPLTPREIHVVAPVSVPTTIPAASGPVTKATEEGTGPLVGTGGPTRGFAHSTLIHESGSRLVP